MMRCQRSAVTFHAHFTTLGGTPSMKITSLLSLAAAFAVALGSPSYSATVSYSTILSLNQSITGVRGYDNTNVVLEGSVTSGGTTVGMWWLGSLSTGVGTMYTPTPTFPGETVTTSLFYSADTALYTPAIGSGNVVSTGSYAYSESSAPNHGFLYAGPINGVGGTWTQIDVPSNVVGGATVLDTIPHSVMGDYVVGNYNLQGSPASGNAFLYRISTQTWTIFNIGGTQNLTSAYGIWKNNDDSYTIVGGSQVAGVNKAFLIDYTPSTQQFTHLTFFDYNGAKGLTHFEGITGASGGYNVIGGVVTGAVFAFIPRNSNGTFGTPIWTPLSYPGASTTTGDTVYSNIGMGIYITPSVTGEHSYTAVVDNPSYNVSLTVAKSGQNATFTIKNTGDTSDNFLLSTLTRVGGAAGPRPPHPKSAPYKITFTYGGKNVTSDVNAGTFTTGAVAPGSSVKLAEKVTLKRPLTNARTIRTTLTATSTGNEAQTDSAKVQIHLTPQ